MFHLLKIIVLQYDVPLLEWDQGSLLYYVPSTTRIRQSERAKKVTYIVLTVRV